MVGGSPLLGIVPDPLDATLAGGAERLDRQRLHEARRLQWGGLARLESGWTLTAPAGPLFLFDFVRQGRDERRWQAYCRFLGFFEEIFSFWDPTGAMTRTAARGWVIRVMNAPRIEY